MSTSRIQNLLDIKSKIALETGFTEKQVSQVVHCFYDDWIKSLLTEFNYPLILIEHLGLFRFRRSRYEITKEFITKELKKYKYYTDRYTSDKQGILDLWEGKVKKLELALINLETLNTTFTEQSKENILIGTEKIKIYKQNNNV